MLTTEQQTIYSWMSDKLQLPVYADVFRGAVIFLNKKTSGHVTFVAHAGREIMNGLARTVRGDKRIRVDYVKHLDGIEAVWEDKWAAPAGFSDVEGNSHYNIPHEVCEKIRSLIIDHKEERNRSAESDEVFFSTFLDYNDRDRIPENFMKEWRDAKKWFNGCAHIRKTAFDSDTDSSAEIHFTNLEGFLHVAASSEFKRIKGINEILEETNE